MVQELHLLVLQIRVGKWVLLFQLMFKLVMEHTLIKYILPGADQLEIILEFTEILQTIVLLPLP